MPDEHEIDIRLLTFAVRLRVPASLADPFAAHFATPAEQGAPLRATWGYAVTSAPDAQLALHEGGDRFAVAPDVASALALLERRVVGRALDHLARWGWLVVAGALTERDGRRTLAIGVDDGARTLLRGGEAVPLPLPLPYRGVLPSRGPLAEVIVGGDGPAPLPLPAALSAVLDAAVAPIPGGPRAAFREVTATLRNP